MENDEQSDNDENWNAHIKFDSSKPLWELEEEKVKRQHSTLAPSTTFGDSLIGLGDLWTLIGSPYPEKLLH